MGVLVLGNLKGERRDKHKIISPFIYLFFIRAFLSLLGSVMRRGEGLL